MAETDHSWLQEDNSWQKTTRHGKGKKVEGLFVDWLNKLIKLIGKINRAPGFGRQASGRGLQSYL